MFDPYHVWLGIAASEQPPNHYRLLGIPLFENAAEVIENAADQRMAHLRTFQTGRHAGDSQRLLNEVAAAKLCLLDRDAKARYDAAISSLPLPSMANPGGLPVAAIVQAPIPLLVPIARPAMAAAPAARPVPMPAEPIKRSIAAERWIVQQRTKAAFLQLLSRSIWTIASIVPMAAAGFAFWQHYSHSGNSPLASTNVSGGTIAATTPSEGGDNRAPDLLLPDRSQDLPQPQQSVASSSHSPSVRAVAEPPPPAVELYPLSRLWFLDFVNGTWENDVHDRFEAKQIGNTYSIKCDIPEGYEQKLIVFHEEEPSRRKLRIKFLLLEGAIYLDFRPKDLTPRGDRIQHEFKAGELYEAEMWIENGTARARVNGQAAPVNNDPTCHGYYAMTVSQKCSVRIYELGVEDFDAAKTQKP